MRELHERYGHIQEIIVQNFRAKPGTQMADAPEPALEEQLWTIAVARLMFGAEMTHPGAAEPAARSARRACRAPASTIGAAYRR